MNVSEYLPALSEDIYTGFWINRSFGSVRGATLTLNRQSGGLLIAFLALFVSTTGHGCWKILRFFLHCYFSAESRMDALHNQRQAILRNCQSANDAIIELTMATIMWREKATKIAQRTLPIMAAAVFISAGFSIAGIFSSKITDAMISETLLSGRDCNLDIAETDMRRFTKDKSILGGADNQQNLDYLTYAMQCYRNDTSMGLQSCQTFTKPTLKYTSHYNAPCPFPKEMCKTAADNILLDTGYIDSFKDLGMNRGPRFSLRRVVHCTPLVTDGYTHVDTDPHDVSVQYINYTYGDISLNPHTHLARFQFPQSQWEIRDFAPDYSVEVKSTPPANNQHVFIPQLIVPSAQTSLYFLHASNIVYIAQTQDPWFSVTTPPFAFGSTMFGYSTQQPVPPIGCAITQSYCRPGIPKDKGCVNFQDEYNFADELANIWPKPADQKVLHPIFRIINDQVSGGSSAFYAAKGLPSLLSRRYLSGRFHDGIVPRDRWQMEFEYLYQATLSSIQFKVLDFARGFSEDVLGNHCGTAGPGCRRLCHSQKIRSSQHYSFSILGLFSILAGGTTITILSIFLENIVLYFCTLPQLRRDQKRGFIYAFVEWHANSTLQLQRQAHENLGFGTWSKTSGGVPVTELGQKIGFYDVTDRKHPRLAELSKKWVM